MAEEYACENDFVWLDGPLSKLEVRDDGRLGNILVSFLSLRGKVGTYSVNHDRYPHPEHFGNDRLQKRTRIKLDQIHRLW